MVVGKIAIKTNYRVLRPADEFCDRLPIYNIAITSLFNAIDREAKELLPYSIFIITRRYKRANI
jgi:hypothetical protein